MKKCVNCGSTNLDDSEFCSVCGKKMEDIKSICPVCNKEIDPIKNFCKYCGSDLKKPKTIPGKKELNRETEKDDLKDKIKNQKKKTGKKNFIKTISIIAALIFIALISYFIIYILAKYTYSQDIISSNKPEKETIETSPIETQQYTYYETLFEYAKKVKPYPNIPADGYTLAYADFIGNHGFCKNVWQSIKDNWVLAGGNLDNLYYFDNEADVDKSLDNIDLVLEKNPDVFVSFQQDLKVNTVTSYKFKQKNIPVININSISRVDNYPYAINPGNFEEGYEMGSHAIKLIKNNYSDGSSFNVIALENNWNNDFLVLQEGFYQAFFDEYGEQTNSFFKRVDISGFDESQIKNSVGEILDYEAPGIDNIVLFSVLYDGLNFALNKATEIGRFNSDKWVVLTFDAYNENVPQMIRNGIIDATLYNFPEKWGNYIIPAAISLLNKETIPGYIYINEKEIVTKENINDFFKT